jgi:hypothetical protein
MLKIERYDFGKKVGRLPIRILPMLDTKDGVGKEFDMPHFGFDTH